MGVVLFSCNQQGTVISLLFFRDKQGKWVVATEARNNVVAACQNITSARRYLSTIEFPYCKPPEVKVLETAASHVYTDMLSQQRHQYVYANVYHIMYKRCKALIDWFTHVSVTCDLIGLYVPVKITSYSILVKCIDSLYWRIL